MQKEPRKVSRVAGLHRPVGRRGWQSPANRGKTHAIAGFYQWRSGRVSNPDSFIDEVTEEVRRDKLFALFRRYGWIGVVLVLLVVGAAAYNEWQKARLAATSRAFGDALLVAIETPDAAARKAALAAVVPDGQNVIVQKLLVAANAVEQKDKPAALAALASIADDASLPQSYRDLANLKRVVLAGADMPGADRIALLQEVATAGRPFRPFALEQVAMVEIEMGQTEAAISHLRDVLQEPLVSQALQSRVSQVMVALGADPAAE